MTKGPGRTKTSVKSKGKRWKKGQSCVTNPSVTTHRQAAAQNRIHPAFRNTNSNRFGSGGLTENALARHNESRGDGLFESTGEGDAQSAGGDTFKTFLSGVSDCSMPAFDKVKRYWESNAVAHKEVCAVLAAVTEVIREKGGKETETEYFGALRLFLPWVSTRNNSLYGIFQMTALETVNAGDSLSAVVFLLSLIIKRVPQSVLRLKYSMVSRVLLDLLAANSATSATSLLRSALTCLSTMLRVQEVAVWSEPSTLQTYQGLLTFTVHHKPKVRKAAQHAVCAILKGSQFIQLSNAPTHHPATAATTKFCIQQIEKHGGTTEATTTLHVLGFLKDVMAIFPKNQLKTVCETILKVMTLSNVLVTSTSMQALHSMFENKPKPECLPKELNAQLINALYDYQPGESDVQPMQAWLAVMQAAHVNLTRLDDRLCLSHLPRLFVSCLACFTSQKLNVAIAAAQVLKTLLQHCLQPTAAWLSTEVSHGNTPVHKMFQTVEGGLSYRYHSSWGLVLQVLNVFFEVFGKEGHGFMIRCVQSMCDLRSTHHFPYTLELDKAVGMAIKKMGPRVVLEAVPLQITGNEDNYDFPRSWLLPILRENICNTELQYFTKEFLPLAAKLKTKSLEYDQAGRKVESKTYDLLQSQVWALLPGFCKGATDVTESFKNIARILGSALSDRPDLRSDVCAGLRHVITSNMENEEAKKELARFAKNFLPILFNLYTTGNSREDSSIFKVLETIKVYIKIADAMLINSLMDKLESKLNSDEKNKHPLMDLAIAMVPHLDQQHTQIVYALAQSMLESTDHTIQKKAYRILEEICEGTSESNRTFVTTHIGELQEALVKSLSSSSPSSKAPRLRCLLHVVKGLSEENTEFLLAILPEMILCTKEVNSKTRALAFSILVEIGHCMVKWSIDEDKQTCIGRYIEMLAAGLAGSPHMISATVLALSRVIYEFKGVVSGSYLEQLIDGVCTLLKSTAREVLRSALAFVKVLSQMLDQAAMAQFVKQLIQGIAEISEVNRRGLRKPIKSIYSLFLRKYGFQMTQKLVPEYHQKMLQNMKKEQERKKRQKTMKDAFAHPEDDQEEDSALVPSKPKPETFEELLQDSESESDGEEKAKGQAGGRKAKRPIAKRGKAWLKEGGDATEPLNFLDSGVSKRVMATKPEVSRSKPDSKGLVKHNFKTMPDGRLLITEDANEEEEKEQIARTGGKRKRTEPMDALEEMMDDELAQQKKGKSKRKMDDISISDDEEEDQQPMKYQAGGSGIHRPVANSNRPGKESKAPGAEYRSKKAKGDMKKKGKPDPYTYLPLNRQQLNKRKSKKPAGQWQNLVSAAKKGAFKGQKGNKKHKKKR